MHMEYDCLRQSASGAQSGTSPKDRSVLENLIRKEMYHYSEVKHLCVSIIEKLWQQIHCIDEKKEPVYYRVDRIVKIIEHRNHFELDPYQELDEGELKAKIQFMFSGKNRKIRFAFTGPSVQASLDKIPTAKVIDKEGNASIIEAEIFGVGVNMFLLSQGSHVKALAPPEFVEEMKQEIQKMYEYYCEEK